MVENYHLWRADRTQRGGGLAAFMRSDIAGDRISDLEFIQTEGTQIQLRYRRHVTWKGLVSSHN